MSEGRSTGSAGMAPDTVAPGVLRITVPIPFDIALVNLYLVDTGDGWVLVDTATATDTAFTVLSDGLAAAGLTFRDIRAIVVTHAHSDHAGQAGRIRDLANAPVLMSERDALHIDGLFDAGPPPAPREFFRCHGAPAVMTARFTEVLQRFGEYITPFAADRRLDTGDRVDASRPMVGLLTPGHTPGHLAIVLPDEELLIGGDHVLPDITPNIGAYPIRPSNALAEYLESLDAVLKLGPARIFPAHGPVIEAPEARIRELLTHHDRRLDRIASVTERSGSTAWEVSERIFGPQPEPIHAWLAFFESLAHLDYLARQGALGRGDEGDRVLFAPI